MTEPLVLVVLLGTLPEPADDAMLAATRRALGPDALVLADTGEARDDRSALSVGDRVHARAVVRVTWSEHATSVRLHVHVAAEGPAPDAPWVDDVLGFSTDDPPEEKGRTVGYALASMVQRLEQDRPPPRPPPPLPPPSRPGREIDVRLMAVLAAGGAASAVGGALGAWIGLTRAVGLQGSAGVRAGSVSAADATAVTWFFAAGPGVRVAITRAVAVGARADLRLLRPSLTRDREGSPTRERWLGATDILGELDGSISRRVGFVLGAGAEVAFGPTPVRIGLREVASFPVLRAVTELGVRIRF